MSRTKQNMLMLVVVAGALIAVLAMALPNLVLLPGQPFRLDSAAPDLGTSNSNFPGGGILFFIFQGMIALMVVILFVYIIYSLFSAEGRKRLIVQIILMALLLMVADYIQQHPPALNKDQQAQMPERPQMMQPGEDTIPAAVFSPEPPQWLTLVIVLGGSLIVAFFAIVIASRLRPADQIAVAPLEQLAEEAQNALVSLHSGDDFRPTIIRCYQEMSRVLKQDKGIAREKAMTPREFEGLLIDKGLPQASVSSLTRLFERARYGHATASDADTDLAVACLTDIANACHTVSVAHG